MNYGGQYGGTDQGWGDYPDERGAVGMGAAFSTNEEDPNDIRPGDIAPSDLPEVQRVLQKSSPATVRAYAGKLRAMGYNAPDTGNVFDSDLMYAVQAFQRDHQPAAGAPDGKMGPTFFRVIDGLAGPPLAAPPSIIIPSAPGGGLQPVSTGEDSTAIWWVVGGGALVAGLAAWYFLK